jgi:hypothetical protein
VSRLQVVVRVSLALPGVFAIPVHAYDGAPGLVGAWEAREDGVVRRVAAFRFDVDMSGTRAMQDQATDLFAELFGEVPENIGDGLLDGRRAVEVSGVVGEHGGAWLRLAQPAPGQAVAFCYSGPDPLPDQDSKIFNDLATRCVRISVVDASTPK